MFGSAYKMGYAIQEQLGKGGFSTVYRAQNLNLNEDTYENKDVAIKVISQREMKKRKFERKVEDEIRIHYQLEHDNIVKLLEHFEDDENKYLVLEFCENDTLKRYLDENGPLCEREAQEILRQIVDGLLYLQRKHSIVHRDIKPDNLLLTKTPANSLQVKIADFGLATKLRDSEDKHMTMCGTPNYLAPEVATRSSHGLPVDCWALGCILYALLVGKPPFDSNNMKNTVTQVVMTNPQIPDHISSNAKQLILNLLQKDPTKRMKLTDVLEHPFMKRTDFGSFRKQSDLPSRRIRSNSSSSSHRRRHQETLDSGVGSNSSPLGTYHSSRSRSVEKYLSRTPLHPVSFNSENNNYKIKTKYLQESSQHSIDKGSKIFVNLPTKLDKQYFGHDENMSPEDFPERYYSRDAVCKNYKENHRIGSIGEIEEHDVVSDCDSPPSLRHQKQQHKSQDQVNLMSLNKNCLNLCYEINKELQLEKNNNLSSNYSKRSSGENSNSNNTDKNKINVPPINTERLAPIRHVDKHWILSILNNGEFCLEFVQKVNGNKKVMEVIRITSDGLRIVLYEPINQPNGKKGVPVRDSPPPLPLEGADFIFSYESLPQKHWKKYLRASRFISLVKAQTVKITYYSPFGKCELMENTSDPDFRVLFYKGDQIKKSANTIRFVDSKNVIVSFDMKEGDSKMNKNSETLNLWIHFKQCHSYCLNVDSAMSSLSFPPGNDSVRSSNFPLIIGKRPTDNVTVNSNKTGSSPSPAIKIPLSNNMNSSCGTSMSKYEQHGSKNKRFSSTESNQLAKVEIPKIGIAQECPAGGISVQYFNGSKLSIPGKSDNDVFVWRSKDGIKTEYSAKDWQKLSSELKKKLGQIPHISKLLADSKTKQPSRH